MQEHAFGIDVAHVDVKTFVQAQTAGIDGGQTDTMVEKGNVIEQAAHFGGREDDGQFELKVGASQLDFGGPESLEGFLPEELDGAKGLGGGLAGNLLDGLEMEEVLAELLGADLIGRGVEVFAQLTNAGKVRLFGAGADGQELQVLGEGIKDGVRGGFFICMSFEC